MQRSRGRVWVVRGDEITVTEGGVSQDGAGSQDTGGHGKEITFPQTMVGSH